MHTGVEAVSKPILVDKKRADRYEIPRGSWFEWVSCAHYLAEIVRFFGALPAELKALSIVSEHLQVL